jgi:hypothetical protein
VEAKEEEKCQDFRLGYEVWRLAIGLRLWKAPTAVEGS